MDIETYELEESARCRTHRERLEECYEDGTEMGYDVCSTSTAAWFDAKRPPINKCHQVCEISDSGGALTLMSLEGVNQVIADFRPRAWEACMPKQDGASALAPGLLAPILALFVSLHLARLGA